MKLVDRNTERNYGDFYVAKKKYQNKNAPLTDFVCDWRSTAPWMKLFRKDFVIKNNLKFLEGIRLGAEDIPFTWIAYFNAKKISFCENAYYYYNLIPESLDRIINENILEIFDALNYTKNEYLRFDPSRKRQSQLDTLFVSHTFYQFSKIYTNTQTNNIKLASFFWDKARTNLTDIEPEHIIQNKFLRPEEKEFFFDVNKYASLYPEMQKKYFENII